MAGMNKLQQSRRRRTFRERDRLYWALAELRIELARAGRITRLEHLEMMDRHRELER